MTTKINLSVIAFMLCILQPASGYTPGFTDGGSCTETAFWQVDALETGGLKLTVYGTGATHSASHSGNVASYVNANPYAEYVKDIVEIDVKEGITHIGAGNFVGMIRVRKISLPQSLTDIGFCAFGMALSSDCITVIPSSVTGIGTAAFMDAFADVEYLPESSVEMTDEQFQYLLRNYQWTDTVPLYFESIPVHSGKPIGINTHGIFGHDNETVTTPVIFYVKEDLVASAQQSSVFLDAWNIVDVTPVAYRYPPGKYNATIYWEYDAETETLTLSGYGDVGDDRAEQDPWKIYKGQTVNIIVGEGITRLGYKTFRYFTNLEHVQLPNSLTNFYGWTFHDCSKLKSVILPPGLHTIGVETFENTALETVVFQSTEPPRHIPGYFMSDIALPWDNPGFTVYVPPHAIQNYRTAEYYSEHASQIKSYESLISTKGITSTDTIRILINDTTRVPVTVNDTTRVEHIINDTTHILKVAVDTIYLTDTVWTTQYKTEYDIIFIPLEIKTDIYPFPEKTDTPFLLRLTPTTFQTSSPYDRETLYFYNISGELADKVTYLGGDTVQTSRPFYHTVIVVSDRGWYQIIR